MFTQQGSIFEGALPYQEDPGFMSNEQIQIDMSGIKLEEEEQIIAPLYQAESNPSGEKFAEAQAEAALRPGLYERTLPFERDFDDNHTGYTSNHPYSLDHELGSRETSDENEFLMPDLRIYLYEQDNTTHQTSASWVLHSPLHKDPGSNEQNLPSIASSTDETKESSEYEAESENEQEVIFLSERQVALNLQFQESRTRAQSPEVVIQGSQPLDRGASLCSLPPRTRQNDPRNRWTREQRQAVFVLERWYSVKGKDFAKIFYHTFEDDLRRCGFTSGFPIGRIQTQMADTCSVREYREVYVETAFNDSGDRWSTLRGRLEESAKALGIDLRRKTHGGRRIRPMIQKIGRPRLNLQSSPKQRPKVTSPALEKPPTMGRAVDEGRINSLLDEIMPALLYRTYDRESMGINSPTLLRAGRFRQGRVPTPLTDSDNFRRDVANHLNRSRVHSPFISLTRSLLRAFHIARKSQADGKDPHIVVVDSKIAHQNQRLYHGPQVRFLANEDIETENRRYGATCEWLAWGEIASDAIISDFRFQDIEALAMSRPSVNIALRLQTIDPMASVGKVSANLRSDQVCLTRDIAAGLGKVARIMGFRKESDGAHLSRAVETIFEGWSLVGNIDTMGDAFFQGLIDEWPEEAKRVVLQAFQEGAQRGMAHLDQIISKTPTKRLGPEVVMGLSTP